jgi:hypothetical protein
MDIVEHAGSLQADISKKPLRVLCPVAAVRYEGGKIFRLRSARDLGCLLDVEPSVASWKCMPSPSISLDHVPRFDVVHADASAVPWMPPIKSALAPLMPLLMHPPAGRLVAPENTGAEKSSDVVNEICAMLALANTGVGCNGGGPRPLASSRHRHSQPGNPGRKVGLRVLGFREQRIHRFLALDSARRRHGRITHAWIVMGLPSSRSPRRRDQVDTDQAKPKSRKPGFRSLEGGLHVVAVTTPVGASPSAVSTSPPGRGHRSGSCWRPRTRGSTDNSEFLNYVRNSGSWIDSCDLAAGGASNDVRLPLPQNREDASWLSEGREASTQARLEGLEHFRKTRLNRSHRRPGLSPERHPWGAGIGYGPPGKATRMVAGLLAQVTAVWLKLEGKKPWRKCIPARPGIQLENRSFELMTPKALTALAEPCFPADRLSAFRPFVLEAGRSASVGVAERIGRRRRLTAPAPSRPAPARQRSKLQRQ